MRRQVRWRSLFVSILVALGEWNQACGRGRGGCDETLVFFRILRYPYRLRTPWFSTSSPLVDEKLYKKYLLTVEQWGFLQSNDNVWLWHLHYDLYWIDVEVFVEPIHQKVIINFISFIHSFTKPFRIQMLFLVYASRSRIIVLRRIIASSRVSVAKSKTYPFALESLTVVPVEINERKIKNWAHYS